jgi:cysteine-rich repeat protein
MSRRWLVAVSIVAHLSILIGVFVSGVWRIDRLDHGPLHARLDGWRPPPPPAPSGGPIAAKLPDFVPKARKPVTKALHQPQPPIDDKPAEPEIGTGSGSGSGSGSDGDTGTCRENCGPPAPPADPVCGNSAVEAGEQCDDGNTVDGDGCSSTCRIEVKPPPQPTNVLPTVLQGLRISGETQVHPSAVTQNQMMHEGTHRVDATIKLCIGTDGAIVSTSVLATTGYPAYDAALVAAVGQWRYQPYLVSGRAVPACSTVHFVYTIR